MNLRLSENLWSAFFLVLAVCTYNTAAKLQSGSGLFPQVTAILFGLGASLTLLRNMRSKLPNLIMPFDDIRWKRWLVIAFTFVIALSLLKTIGFPIISAVMFVVCATAADMGKPTWLSMSWNTFTGCVLVAILTGVFVSFLGVSLPMGLLNF